MIGDILIITDYHRNAAAQILPRALQALDSHQKTIALTIAGESGCGKTETAACLKESLSQAGKNSIILGQDDYFKLPPKTNHQTRLKDIDWVGTNEVHLDQMSNDIKALKEHPDAPLTKPLVIFDQDRIDSETIQPSMISTSDVIIAEGTYTTLLDNIDIHAFINRTYHQTRKNRLLRNRDSDHDFLEQVLEREHKIISAHRSRAHIIIPPPPEDLDPDPTHESQAR